MKMTCYILFYINLFSFGNTWQVSLNNLWCRTNLLFLSIWNTEIIAVLYSLVVTLILAYGHCEKYFKKYACNLSLYTDILFPGYSSEEKNCWNEMFDYLIFIKNCSSLLEDIVHFQLFYSSFLDFLYMITFLV